MKHSRGFSLVLLGLVVCSAAISCAPVLDPQDLLEEVLQIDWTRELTSLRQADQQDDEVVAPTEVNEVGEVEVVEDEFGLPDEDHLVDEDDLDDEDNLTDEDWQEIISSWDDEDNQDVDLEEDEGDDDDYWTGDDDWENDFDYIDNKETEGYIEQNSSTSKNIILPL